MKNKIYFAVSIALLMALFAINTVAFAGNGAATPFKAEYDSSILGHTDCSGARVIQGNGKVKDSQTCTLSGNTLASPGTYVGSPSVCIGGFCGVYWQSDFDGQIATSVTFTIVDNGDGTFTLNLVAYY